MPTHPPTQGTLHPIFQRRLTHVLAWALSVLIAPAILLQAVRELPAARAEQATEQRTAHTFRFDASALRPAPTRMNVAGTFNGWNREATPMTARGSVWEATVPLTDGITLYKFVADGDRWITDPDSDKELEEDDGHGGKNSAVLIGPDFRKLDPVKPGDINHANIRFDPSKDVNVADASHVRFQLRLQAGDAERVYYNVMDSRGSRTGQMVSLGKRLGYETFAGIATAEGETVKYWFTVYDGPTKATVGPTGVRKFAAGADAPDQPDAFTVAMQPTFETPAWARDVIWYQIFPERFRNGDKTNDPGDFWYERYVPWTGDWWTALPGETPGAQNFYQGAGNVWKRRYGGDLAGVKEKLGYLRSVGVTAIYFNPIFEAESMHKYDTADYRHVDDNFGVRDEPKEQRPGAPEREPAPYKPIGNRQLFELDGTPVSPDYRETDDPATWKWTRSDLLFLDFLAEAHRQGFKVVVDGVFNHVGRAHPFFQDVLAKGQNSRYADWFAITDWGDPANWRAMEDPYQVHGKPGGIQWKGWDKDNGHLPAFRKDDQKGLAPGPYAHIMAITERWLAPGGDPTKGIDGWRLDVPGDIPHGFWIDWRKTVKAAKPDAYITGEIWSWAQPWLQGDQFDAVMNYRFAEAVQDFFVDRKTAIKPSEFDERLKQIIFNYPLQVSLVQQNLFDSHDTDRIASMFVNPDRPYDGQNRPQDNAREVGYDDRRPTDEEWQRFLQAVAFQMTFVGAPMIYYGNEAGMYSPDDPSNRMPMWWDDLAFDNPDFRFDPRVFAFHQRAAAARNTLAALRTGSFRPVLVDDARGIYAFAREQNGQAVYVVLNRSNQPQAVQIPVDDASAGFFDYLDEAATVVRFDPGDPTARPVLVVKPGAAALKPVAGKLGMNLKPYGAAIIAP